MAIKLLQKFKRNTSPLQVPEALAEGVSHGPSGTWAWVLIPGRATDEQNTSTIFQMTADGANDLRRLIPAGAEFHFKIQWGRWSGDDYLREETRPNMPEQRLMHVELGANRITEQRYARRMVLLGVQMDDGTSSAGDPGYVVAAKRALGTSTKKRDATAALAATMKKVQAWHERMRESSFQARPATPQELSWALSRDIRRSVDWVPAGDLIGPGQLSRLMAAQMANNKDHLEASTENGQRFLRMVTCSETGFPATEMELPGGEWLKDLNIVSQEIDDETDESAPVEVSIRGRNITQLAAVTRLRKALALTKEQEREASRGLAGEAPDTVYESGLALRRRLEEVQNGNIGMIEDAPVWIVEAKSLEQLDARTEALIARYGARGITVWAPPHIQDLLWKETVLGDTRRVAEFTQFRPISTLVGAWFHGGSEVGERRGPYLGGNVGSTPGPFRSRLSDAQRTRQAITTAFLGMTGSGKSTGVCLYCIAEAAYGSWVGLVDYKGDLAGSATAAEFLGIPVTRLSTSRQASGSMCSFRFIQNDPIKAASYAIDNLIMLVGGKNRDTRRDEALIRNAALAIAALPDPDARSTAAVIDYLANSDEPDSRRLGVELRDIATDPLARAVVGRPDPNAPSLPTTPGFIYLGFDDLRWPGRETARDDWNPGHRLSMMVAQAGIAYLTYMSSEVKGIPKVIALTELHRLTRYDFGRGFISDIARTGSALDTNLLLDTQACAELVSIDGLVDQINQVHAFRVGSDSEADAQAILLGLEPEEKIRVRQKSWGQGQCLTKDRAGRIAPVQFDYLCAEIQDALKTQAVRDEDSEQHVDAVPDSDGDVHPTVFTTKEIPTPEPDLEPSR